MPKYAHFDSTVAAPSPVIGWFDSDTFKYTCLPAVADLLEISDAQWAARLADPNGWAVNAGVLVAYTPSVSLAQAQAMQKSVMLQACSAAILAGFSSSALGSAYNYPSDDNTQRNIAMAAVSGGQIWCETGGTWAMVPHTAAQAQQVQKDLFVMVQVNQAKYATLLAEITAASTVAAVQAIVWTA